MENDYTSLEVMCMGEENKNRTSQKLKDRIWFWPTVYSLIAIMMVVMMFAFNALTEEEDVAVDVEAPVVVETNARAETMKYPFKEEHRNMVSVLQDYYDVTADNTVRENALLVFNQTFSTSNGVSLSINKEPFEVVAAMSGEIIEVKLDAFSGNRISVLHANGMITRYSSVTDILVQEGDVVSQGEQIATTAENEANPEAGIHLHFEILQEGKSINPRTLLAF